jgi:hypothetical protein
MTIREFQLNLRATHTPSRLFSALRRLRTFEGPQMLESEDMTSSNWIVWGDLAEPGCSTQAS